MTSISKLDIIWLNASQFKKIIEVIKQHVNEITFICTITEIILIANHECNVSQFVVNIPSTAFLQYNYQSSSSSSSSIIFNVNVKTFYPLLTCCKNTDPLKLHYEDEKNSIELISESIDKKNKSIFCYEIENIHNRNIYYTDENQLKELGYNSATILSKDFKKMIQEIKLLSSICMINIDEKGFTISSVDSKSGVIKLHNNCETILKTTNINQKYAVQYLLPLLKGTLLSNYVIISQCENAPLHIVFDMGLFGKISYFLSFILNEEE